MTRRDEGKVSLVEFLRSIKFGHDHRASAVAHEQCPTHFALFKQSARAGSESSQEDTQLIRSAN
ncbi:MAG: hypothetical protein V7754_12610 [Halioglobus sp.]